MESFKSISNFRTKKDKTISNNVLLNFDFDDVVITDNSFKYVSTFETIDVTNFKWNCNLSSRIILINQNSSFEIKTPFPSGSQCVAIQSNNSIDQDIFLNTGEYSLSFFLQKRANYAVNPIQVSIAGTVIFTVSTIPEVWTLYTIKFNILASSITNIKFMGLETTDATTAIDLITILQLYQGLTFAGYSGYLGNDPNYFTGKTPIRSGYSSIFTNLTTSTNGTYIVDKGDDFSIQWLGYFLCNETGTWTFSTSSDDGSYMLLGDSAKTGNFTVANCLINNSGYHPVETVTKTINLVTNTMYPIRIQYGESGGGNDMNVYFIKPSGGTTKIYDGTGYYFNTMEDSI